MNENYLYILRLKNDKYYVGITKDIKKRLYEHFTQNHRRNKWLTENNPIFVQTTVELSNKTPDQIKAIEESVTIRLSRTVGNENVRGSRWCSQKNPPYVESAKVVDFRLMTPMHWPELKAWFNGYHIEYNKMIKESIGTRKARR